MSDEEYDGGDSRTATGLLVVGGILASLLVLGGIVVAGMFFWVESQEIAFDVAAPPPPAIVEERDVEIAVEKDVLPPLVEPARDVELAPLPERAPELAPLPKRVP